MLFKSMLASGSSLLIVGGALTILAAGLGGVTPAYASEPAPRSERVSYADLDLRRAAGQRVLHSRLRRATQRVCRQDGIAAIVARQRERACAAETMRVALSQTPLATQFAEAR